MPKTKKSSPKKPCPRCLKLQARVSQLEWVIQDLRLAQQAAERHRLGLPPEGNAVTRALAEQHQANLQVAVAMRLVPEVELPEVAASRLAEEHRSVDLEAAFQQLRAEQAELYRRASRNRSSKRVVRGRAAR